MEEYEAEKHLLYEGCRAFCKGEKRGRLGEYFDVKGGVKQEGILSPSLCYICVDQVVSEESEKATGNWKRFRDKERINWRIRQFASRSEC